MNNAEIEIVLNELLEEQKKETLANGEIITILKQLLEKTSTIEKEFQPGDTPTLSERIRVLQVTCENRQKKIELVKNEPVYIPVPRPPPGVTISYSYHLKAIITAVVFFIVSLVYIIKYYSQRNELSRCKSNIIECQENDLKYMFIKTNTNKVTQKTLRQIDSLYKLSPGFLVDSIRKVTKRTTK